MSDVLCANCAYESEEVSEGTGYCQTCQRAFRIGYRVGKEEVANV
jgi:hypothetical protein